MKRGESREIRSAGDASRPRRKSISPAAGKRKLPEYLSDIITAYIVHKVGKPVEDPVVLEKIRQAVMAQKATYWKGKQKRHVRYDKGYSVFAYLAYQAPVYIMQDLSFIRRLDNTGLIPDDIRLFDIGTGPGTIPIALVEYMKERGRGSLTIQALERSEEHLEAFRYILSDLTRSMPQVRLKRPLLADLTTKTDLPSGYNLLTFQNVLSELSGLSIEDQAALILRYAENLDPDSVIILVEPADLEHSADLRRVQNELLKRGLSLAGPCSFIWGARCHPEECWSFFQDDSIQPTPLMNLLSGEDEAFRFTNTDIKYSYAILTRRQISFQYQVPKNSRHLRLSQIPRHAGRVVSVTVAKMSGDLGNAHVHIFKVCDGTCHEPVYVVIPKRKKGPRVAALLEGRYGDILVLEDMLVRRHPQYRAWNLLPTSSTDVYPPKEPSA